MTNRNTTSTCADETKTNGQTHGHKSPNIPSNERKTSVDHEFDILPQYIDSIKSIYPDSHDVFYLPETAAEYHASSMESLMSAEYMSHTTFSDFNIIHMEMLKGVQKVSILYKNRCRYIVMRVFTYSDWATLESLLHNIEGVKFKWLMLKIAIHGVWGPHTEPSFSGKAVVSHQFTHELCMHYQDEFSHIGVLLEKAIFQLEVNKYVTQQIYKAMSHGKSKSPLRHPLYTWRLTLITDERKYLEALVHFLQGFWPSLSDISDASVRDKPMTRSGGVCQYPTSQQACILFDECDDCHDLLGAQHDPNHQESSGHFHTETYAKTNNHMTKQQDCKSKENLKLSKTENLYMDPESDTESESSTSTISHVSQKRQLQVSPKRVSKKPRVLTKPPTPLPNESFDYREHDDESTIVSIVKETEY